MRLLTLVCFFHFSGLNNGLSAIVISGGKIQSIELAPAIATKCATALRPANLKRVFLDPIHLKLFPKSAEAARYASQRAFQNILAASEFFEHLLRDTLIRSLDRARAHITGKVGISVKTGVKFTSHSQPQHTTSGQVSLNKNPLNQLGVNQGTFSNLGQKLMGIRDSPVSMKGNRKRTWLAERFHLWDRHGPGSEFHNDLLHPGHLSSAKNGISPPDVRERLRKSVQSVQDWVRARRLFFASEKSDADPSGSLNIKGPLSFESPRNLGVILFLPQSLHSLQSSSVVQTREAKITDTPKRKA